MKAGECSPVTVNNWLRLFRGIMNEAVDELGLEKNPLLKVRRLDTSAHVTYTEEEPNALTPQRLDLSSWRCAIGIRSTSAWWRSGSPPAGGRQ